MRTLIQAQQALTGYTRRHAKRIVEGDLGNNAGVVDHPTRTNYVYVHLHGDDNQIIEAEAVASFPHTAGIIVAVEELKRTGSSRWQVLGIASNILYPSSIWAGTVGEHASQHQRRDLGEGGFDPLDIYNRALVNLRARAQATPDMTLYVQRGFYFIGGALYEWTGGNSGAFTAPASSPFLTIRRCDLLYIGSDNALHIVTGATTSDGSLPPYPTTPTTCIPIAYVYLTSNTTIIEEEVIKDARVILTASDATAAAHNLLSAIHGDTLAASVADGDIIIGNVTPKWSRLAISVPAAAVRNVLGVDNGELRPSWKAIFDAVNPAALGTAAPGTELTAAHRGHVHPTTNLALLNAANVFTQNQTISKASPKLNLLNTANSLITSVTHTQINAPSAAGGSGDPGETYTIVAGSGDGAGPGGSAVLQGGNGGATGAGGSIGGTGGTGGAAGGAGGDSVFNGGAAIGGDSNGGNVIFNVGLKSGLGINGLLKFGTGGADFAIMGIGGISGGDKTFTFPNVSGTFALGAGTITNATTNDVTVAAHTHAVSGTFAATAHNLFSTTHGDTTGAASPVDGDMIIGNVTPKWSKLAISIPAAGTLNYLGVNNGELRPSWKSASSDPGATSSILATVSGVLNLGNSAIGQPLRLYRDANAGDSTNNVEFQIGNSGSGQGRGVLQYYNAAATGSPLFQFESQPRKNDDSGNFQAGAIRIYKTAGASTGYTAIYGNNGATYGERLRVEATGNVLIGTTTDGMTAAGSLAITKDLAHRGTLAGFYNTAPVAQQTGDIVAGLNNLGLFTAASLKLSGIHHSKSITYISGTGTAGADNTAQTVKTLTLAANSLTQVGDRMRIRAYWRGDTGAAITGSCKIGPAGSEVLVSHTTDTGGATLQLNEVWLHYIDNTHANIIENEAGALGALSAANTAGFVWNGAHAIIFTQDAIVNNHTVLYALIVDIFPKGVI